EFRHIVRMADTDLDGSQKVAYALTKIKGVGIRLAGAIVRAAGVNPEERLGNLTDEEIERLEDAIRNPLKYGIPPYLLNRQRDPTTGKDLHLIGADLTLQVKADIDLMKKIKCWKGVRHSLGLKVRGQRTRTTGRKGATVGVRRKKK
ncbi:MAG TPA: 30S ribosomal protein S13, partial [Candidatus Bathyarchaeota archaeon]|nr:30S ribosomal protein S13 [Candidatus Bathyarchaeota archaeon]